MTQTSPFPSVPGTLVNEDLTLGEDLRQLPLELPVLLIIGQRLNRSGGEQQEKLKEQSLNSTMTPRFEC